MGVSLLTHRPPYKRHYTIFLMISCLIRTLHWAVWDNSLDVGRERLRMGSLKCSTGAARLTATFRNDISWLVQELTRWHQETKQRLYWHHSQPLACSLGSFHMELEEFSVRVSGEPLITSFVIIKQHFFKFYCLPYRLWRKWLTPEQAVRDLVRNFRYVLVPCLVRGY